MQLTRVDTDSLTKKDFNSTIEQMQLSLTSASGILSLLDENTEKGSVYALHRLNAIVDVFWPEISDSISKVESLYEDENFKHRELAALVSSKVYYHLGSLDNALTYALGAGRLFDVNDKTEYVETIIAHCIDKYTKLQVEKFQSDGASNVHIDQRLEDIVNRMFQRCFDDKKYKQAIGIALETRRIDVFEKAIKEANHSTEMLTYAFKITMQLLQNRKFRTVVLRTLVRLYLNLQVPDFISVCQCLIFLDDPNQVAEILQSLVRGTTDQMLMAYQIGFDLYESATQQFLNKIQDALRVQAPIPIIFDKTEGNKDEQQGNTGAESMETNQDDASRQSVEESTVPKDKQALEQEHKDKVNSLSQDEKQLQERIEKILNILSGEITIGVHMQFLIKNNHADLLILKQIKDAVRNSVCHTATVIANGYMLSGTTSDQFFRDNLDWLARATNWAKFTAAASLGVIHKGHVKEALNLMSAYLPKDSTGNSPYAEGGGLYALGLIHANHGGDIIEYLINQLRSTSTQTETVRHGACLGLGLAAMGTARSDVYELLKTNLLLEDAVAGEAAGLAMGLVMLGTGSAQAIDDMVQYAQDTQHEKILRGLAIGIALVQYGRLEEADALIEQLQRDKDPILRRSAMYTVAMAYCGTGNNAAVRKLLHVAVSDVNDDVRRSAVESLGFLMFRTPEQFPSVVNLLAESYNPHVRCGAAMALGLACAGTGNREAIAVLEPMLNDAVNYVRQGVLIASALICIQHTEATCPKVKMFREHYMKVIGDKHDDVMAKFGAILAHGILDAGGRNVTVSLLTRSGQTDTMSVVGLLVFTQFWYWFPLSLFLSLAFSPTCLVALNQDLKMPNVDYISNAPPSVFAYPPALVDKKEEKKEKVETAVLSITAKQKKRDQEKKGEKSDESNAMETESDEKKATTTDDDGKSKKDTDDKDKVATTEKKDDSTIGSNKKEKEPDSEILHNPTRVVKAQQRLISLPKGSRYQPIKDITHAGIILVKDTQSNEPETLVELAKAGGPTKEEDLPEPPPPEPFEYRDE